MALGTYSDLQTAILNWLARPGDSNIPVTDCIALLETDASQRLRTHYQETSTTITTISGTDTYSLPVDFKAPRELKITSTNPTVTLEYLPPGQLDDTWFLTTQNQPVNYTIEGTSIRLAPIPNAIYTIRVGYWQAIPALSNSNTTNWLLTNFPNIYLFGSLAEAELFLGADSSDDRYQLFVNRREAAYQALISADRKYRTGGTPLVMKTDSGTP